MVLRRLKCKGRLTNISFANPVTIAFAAGALWMEKTQKEDYSRLGETLTPKEDFDGPADRHVPSLEEQAKNAKSAQTLTPQE